MLAMLQQHSSLMTTILMGSKMRKPTPLQWSLTQTTNTMKLLTCGAAMPKQHRWCARTNSPMRDQSHIALSWMRSLERRTSTAQDSISRALTKPQVVAIPQVLALLFWATSVISRTRRKTKKRSLARLHSTEIQKSLPILLNVSWAIGLRSFTKHSRCTVWGHRATASSAPSNSKSSQGHFEEKNYWISFTTN